MTVHGMTTLLLLHNVPASRKHKQLAPSLRQKGLAVTGIVSAVLTIEAFTIDI
jgi:hypothetical protein